MKVELNNNKHMTQNITEKRKDVEDVMGLKRGDLIELTEDQIEEEHYKLFQSENDTEKLVLD